MNLGRTEKEISEMASRIESELLTVLTPSEQKIFDLNGFAHKALPIISILGTLVDPPATMINSSGDTVAAMMVSRLLEKKQNQEPASTAP